jgi:acetate kinase
MRELLQAEREGNSRASLAIDMFCYRVRKYIGAFLAVLGGADAVVFGGGIGEKSAAVRQRICTGMDWCGLVLDPELNAAATGIEARISTSNAGVTAQVIPVDEATVIVRETLACLAAHLPG